MPIYKEDVVRLLRADLSHASDPVMQQYILLALEGRLARAKGRPKKDARYWFRIQMAEMLVEEYAAEIRAERRRKPGHDRTRLSPVQQAANEVSGCLELHVDGAALLNAISSLKRKGLSVKAPPRKS